MSTAALEELNGAMPGDDFVPTGDDAIEEVSPGDVLEEAGKPAVERAAISADTLALIAGDDKPKTVPHSRFNEVNEEAKASRARVLLLEEELARAKGGAPAPAKDEPKPTGYDFDAAEDRYAAALLDGDTASAKVIRAEIRVKERAEAIAEAEAVADRRYSNHRAQDDAARNKTEFSTALTDAYTTYSFLDAESPDKNQEAIDETLVWVSAFQSKGQSPAKALASAVAKIGPRYAPVAEKLGDLSSIKPDLQKGIDRAAKIPPNVTGVGTRAVKVDVNKMTGDDIRKLSAEDRARLEGDNL